MGKIFKLQKKAAHIILNVHNIMTPSSALLIRLRWMPIYRKDILVFKSLCQLTSEYLYVFKYVHEVSSRNTRQSERNLLYIPKARTEYFKRSFVMSGSLLWNNLQSSIRNCSTIECFKRTYLDNYFNMSTNN